jgi:hypothetical protein
MSLKDQAKNWLQNPNNYANSSREVQIVDSTCILKKCGVDQYLDHIDFYRVLVGSCDEKMNNIRTRIINWVNNECND